MIILNLLPDIKREYVESRRARAKWISMSILVTIAAVGVTVLVALWVYGAQTIHKAALEGAIEENSAELAKKDLSKYLTIQNQLQHVSSLHKDKHDFSRLFAFLPNLNPAQPNNVKINNLRLSVEDATIQLQGEAPSYKALATFKDTLANADVVYTPEGSQDSQTDTLFTKVSVTRSSLSDSSAGGQVVSYQFELVYQPEAFVFSNKKVSVKVPNKETTNSAENVPVFGESTVEGKEE